MNTSLLFKLGLFGSAFVVGAVGGQWIVSSRSAAPPEPATAKVRPAERSKAGPRVRGPAVASFTEAAATRSLFQRAVAVTRSIAKATPADCRGLLEACDPADEAALAAASARWAASDPAGLLQYLLGPGKNLLSARAVSRELFRAWIRQDADAAIAAVQQINHPIQRDRIMTDLLGALLFQEPARVLALAEGLEKPAVGRASR